MPAETSSMHSYMLVLDGGSSSMVHLPLEGTVRIGRAAGSTIQLADAAASPDHAMLTVSPASAQVVDLASANGTLINGERLAGVQTLASGDVLTIGGATLVFHRDPVASARRAVLDISELLARLNEEIARAERHRRMVTLLVIDLGEGMAGRASAEAVAADNLRIGELIAWAGDTQLLVVLPETAGTTTIPATRLLKAFGDVAPRARAGFATCPLDGCDADTLLTAARTATKLAQVGEVRSAAEIATTFTIGQQRAIVADPAMVRLFALVEKLAASEIAVLVSGETGVGKEIMAAAIHEWSPRRGQRLLAINCAAVPETLLESELFGHEKGSFSGAVSTKPGLFESAQGGTVLLDEIGELPAQAQAKLLRVIETRRVARLGAVTEREIDVRLIATTNRILETEMREGHFRQDLFFRLGAATVIVPPLRDRPLDLPHLARAFLAAACMRLERLPMSISPTAMMRLASHDWPGNVRELKNLMEFIAATINEPVLEAEQLPAPMRSARKGTASGAGEAEPAARGSSLLTAQEAGAATNFRNIHEEIEELERARMKTALEATRGVRVRAAELIGMPLRTFVSKLKQYQITFPGVGGRGTQGGG